MHLYIEKCFNYWLWSQEMTTGLRMPSGQPTTKAFSRLKSNFDNSEIRWGNF